MSRPIGILCNPMSGRDVRRLAARATSMTPEMKRDQVMRSAIGAAAAGCDHIYVVKEPFRISTSAVENLQVPARFEVLDIRARCDAGDTDRAIAAMRRAGCAVVVALGGDGTNRTIAKTWLDVPLVPLSTGTNNVFPVMAEATTAGAAAGLVAAGHVALVEVARPVKCVHVEIDGEADDLALVDAVVLVGDIVGNFLPYEPERLRTLVLTRAEPAAVGMSSIGGMLEPSSRDDEFGVVVECKASGEGKPLLVPVSPGLYRTVHVASFRRLDFDTPVEVVGPCVLAFDGDRERKLVRGQRARLSVRRDGPRVIDPARAMRLAAERGAFSGREDWRDGYDEGWREIEG